MLFWCSAPCKNRALDRALWCSPSCKNRALACESCYRQWARHNIYIYLFIYNYLHVSMYMWMFCNHRSPRPCLHTFFIVFRRVPPHTFHTFLVNMISHPHGIPPPCAVYFCHLLLLPSFGNPLKLLWKSFFPFLSRGIYPPWCIHFQKCMKPAPPQFFGLHWGIIIVSLVRAFIIKSLKGSRRSRSTQDMFATPGPWPRQYWLLLEQRKKLNKLPLSPA